MIDFTPDETQELIVKTAGEFGEAVVQPAEIELDRIADPEEVCKSHLFLQVM